MILIEAILPLSDDRPEPGIYYEEKRAELVTLLGATFLKRFDVCCKFEYRLCSEFMFHFLLLRHVFSTRVPTTALLQCQKDTFHVVDESNGGTLGWGTRAKNPGVSRNPWTKYFLWSSRTPKDSQPVIFGNEKADELVGHFLELPLLLVCEYLWSL